MTVEGDDLGGNHDTAPLLGYIKQSSCQNPQTHETMLFQQREQRSLAVTTAINDSNCHITATLRALRWPFSRAAWLPGISLTILRLALLYIRT